MKKDLRVVCCQANELMGIELQGTLPDMFERLMHMVLFAPE